MDNRSFKRLIGGVLSALGALLLLFACFAFMASGSTLLGLDISGAKKIAPTILGLIFLISGLGLINRAD